MALFEDTNPHTLKELLGQIQAGDAALPDFQRNFVWDPGATQDLIVSIANNYPAGSLLRIRNTNDYFRKRAFEGAPDLSPNVTFLVLDGQQRLTSLYQAFFGVGEHRYFLRIRTLMEGGDFEDALFHERENKRRAKRLLELKAQSEELVMPLSVLEGGFGGFGRWSKRVVRSLELDNDARVELEDALDEIEENWIRAIDDYQFPVVTLSDQTGADAVCTIFETLNRTGVKLSVFELLTARFWPQGIRLRDLWDDAVTKYPAIEDFEVDPYYVLQAISLAARTTPSCKRSDVLNLTPDNIAEWWAPVIEGLASTLQVLREDCGVLVRGWLPYNTILIPMSAALAIRPLAGGAEASVRREKLVRWFWCAVFGQAYESSPNSQAARDVVELGAWFDGGGEPEVVTGFRFDPRLLHDTTPRQRAIYRGTICLILRNGARDFHTGQPISGDLIVERHIDDHHIFPDSFLRKSDPELTARRRDCVLNRTLIDRTTNQRISDRAPSDYLAEIRGVRGDTQTNELLESHYLRTDAGAPIWTDDFAQFLEEREAVLWDQIKAVTGATEADDLLAEEAA